MDAEILRQYLEYYDDLGIKTLYRRSRKPLAEDLEAGSEAGKFHPHRRFRRVGADG